MTNTRLAPLAFALAMSFAIAASPADAQGRSKQGKKAAKQSQVSRDTRERPELRRRDGDLDRRQDERWDGVWSQNGQQADRGGPPFCRNGEGHPVHGQRWCEEKGYGLGVYGGLDSRNSRSSTGTSGRYGSYEQSHDEFHRQHDRQCRLRAAERPLDPAWQIRVRTQCKQRHDDWHYRAGRAHD